MSGASLISPEVVSIADNPHCTSDDVQVFHTKLRWLLDCGGYQLDMEDDEEPSLLIRSL